MTDPHGADRCDCARRYDADQFEHERTCCCHAPYNAPASHGADSAEIERAVALLRAGLQHPPTMFYTRPYVFTRAVETVLAALRTPPDDAVEVTQADRERACRIMNDRWTPRQQIAVAAGLNDHWTAVVECARHRFASSTIPPGWQLVPVEPTEEMWRAGATKAKWSAMLAAAPVPPAGQQ